MRDRPSKPLEPDGLILPEVGHWAETKYRLVEHYSQMFSASMKGKWVRVYIDLFAAAGLAKVKGTRRIVRGTALRALGIDSPFDRYVLCELDSEQLEALKERVGREFPSADVRYVSGDCNDKVGNLISELPGEGESRSVLSFCVVDPFNTAHLRFSTLERLAFLGTGLERRIDFLVLVPSHMDAHREQDYYLDSGSTRLEDFLGNPSWRDDWQEEGRRSHPRKFGTFVLDMFGRSMQRLGYSWDLRDAILIGDGQKSLYHLAFFSRHPLGQKFAREARKYSTSQIDLL